MKYRYITIFFISSMSFTMERKEAQRSAWPQEYYQSSLMHLDFAQSQIPFMKLNGDEKILDVGCRTGRITNFIAQNFIGVSIVAIDNSQDMINFARSNFYSENIDFQHTDEERLEFKSQFDVVYSFFRLRWLKNKNKVLSNIANAIKNNGRVYLFLPITSCDFIRGIECIYKVLENHPEWKPFLKLPDNESEEIWINRIEKAGLKVANKQIVEKESVYPNKKAWDSYCYGIGLTTLPTEKAQQFISMANDLLYKEYGLNDEDPYIRKTNILCLELIKN